MSDSARAEGVMAKCGECGGPVVTLPGSFVGRVEHTETCRFRFTPEAIQPARAEDGLAARVLHECPCNPLQKHSCYGDDLRAELTEQAATIEAGVKEYRELGDCFGRFRQDLRTLLYQHGVFSNPGWTEQNIIDALRALLARTPREGA